MNLPIDLGYFTANGSTYQVFIRIYSYQVSSFEYMQPILSVHPLSLNRTTSASEPERAASRREAQYYTSVTTRELSKVVTHFGDTVRVRVCPFVHCTH